MKPNHNGVKKIGKKALIFTRHSNLSFHPRKIPQKSKGSRRDKRQFCGKEKKRNAANFAEAEDVK